MATALSFVTSEQVLGRGPFFCEVATLASGLSRSLSGNELLDAIRFEVRLGTATSSSSPETATLSAFICQPWRKR